MKVSAIVYTSNTGFTAQYATLLSHQTGLPLYRLEECDLPGSTQVLFLGWLCAGKIQGLKGAMGRFQVAGICAVGMAPQADPAKLAAAAADINSHIFELGLVNISVSYMAEQPQQTEYSLHLEGLYGMDQTAAQMEQQVTSSALSSQSELTEMEERMSAQQEEFEVQLSEQQQSYEDQLAEMQQNYEQQLADMQQNYEDQLAALQS